MPGSSVLQPFRDYIGGLTVFQVVQLASISAISVVTAENFGLERGAETCAIMGAVFCLTAVATAVLRDLRFRIMTNPTRDEFYKAVSLNRDGMLRGLLADRNLYLWGDTRVHPTEFGRRAGTNGIPLLLSRSEIVVIDNKTGAVIADMLMKHPQLRRLYPFGATVTVSPA